MKKNFVLDTNVLLYDPNALTSFEDNNVIIPIYVIEEVDTFKKDLSELGRNARHLSRILDELRTDGLLTDGVSIPGKNGSILRVVFASEELAPKFALDPHSADNRILAAARQVQKEDPETPLVFISKDINLRIRAAALGLQVADYVLERTDISELYSGIYDLKISEEKLAELYQNGQIETPDTEPDGQRLLPNSFGVLQSLETGSSALARLSANADTLRLLKGKGPTVWGIRARNKEQRFALELLLDDAIRLVTLVGQAGTGKTLLALAAGLQKTAEEQAYQRLLISRPVFPLGRDIGFLPGEINDKLRPWMQPVHDNLELLLGISPSDKKQGRSSNELLDLDLVHIEPLTYIRGRSIPKQFMLVDEAQNLTPHEVKTIITRAGDDTKIVLTGDPYQIDNSYLDSTNNGLVHVVNRFREDTISGHVTLVKGERSDLAERAARLL
jgi:PhoH-like ATPase